MMNSQIEHVDARTDNQSPYWLLVIDEFLVAISRGRLTALTA